MSIFRLAHLAKTRLSRLRQHFPLLLLFTLILGFALRIYNLDSKSMHLDEVWCVNLAAQGIQYSWNDWGHPPLYYILLHFFLYLGQNSFVARFASVFFGVLSIILAYEIGALLFGRREGIIGAFLLSISPLHIWISQEARMYPLATFLSMLSLFLFYKALNENREKLWVAFLVSTLLAIYSHYYIVLLLFVEAVFFVIMLLKKKVKFPTNIRALPRNKILFLILGLTVASLIFFVWFQRALGLIVTGRGFIVPWGMKPSSFFPHLFSRFVGGSSPFLFFLFFTPFLVGLLISIKEGKEPSSLLWILWFSMPILTVFALTLFRNSPIATPTYLTFVLPAFLLGASKGIGYISDSLSKRLHSVSVLKPRLSTMTSLLFVIILASASIISLQEVYTALPMEDWRSLARYLDQNSRYGDVIVAHPRYAQALSLYHYDVDHKGTKIALLMSDIDSFDTLKFVSFNFRTWFIYSLRLLGGIDRERKLIDWLNRNYMRVQTFIGDIFLFYRPMGLIFISTENMNVTGYWSRATFNFFASESANYTIAIHAKSQQKRAVEVIIDGTSQGTKLLTAHDWTYTELTTSFLDSGPHEIVIINETNDTIVVFNQAAIWRG